MWGIIGRLEVSLQNQWMLFASILIVTAALALFLAGLLARRSRVTLGRADLAYSLILLAVWAFCYAMVILSTSYDAKLVWFKFQHVGIVGQPVFWFLFALSYTSLNRPLKWIWKVALCVIPAISLGLVFSTNWFPLYYASLAMTPDVGGPFLAERGPAYWLQWTQNNLLTVVSAVLLLRWFFANRFLYRWRLGLLTAAVLLPWAAILAHDAAMLFNARFSVPINFSPITLTVSAGLVGAILFGFRTFDILPIARDVVMEHIPEMVVVTDAHDRVLDANSVARQWLGKNEKEIIGWDPMDVFHDWPQLVRRFLLNHETREEIQAGDPPRTYELNVTPIYGNSNDLQGRVIVVHDITERKKLEDSLRTQLEVNESLRIQLQEQAIRDPLTGAFNRRYFAETLDREVSRAAREGQPVSIVILDLDFFKKFNDTYGHKCGDVVLQALTDFLVKNTRGGDIVCRYGGEEFVILLPNTALESAYERAERLRVEYETLAVAYRGANLRATFSAGVAVFPDHGDDGEAILHSADQALYQSKKEGRNRVTIYSLENP
jgi:diguanylate cyclase (GGDEF)-like protein/PAS domain S-box-containing protein